MDSFLKLWIAIVCVSSKLIIKNKEKENSINPIETLKERKNHGKQKTQNEVAKLSANICVTIVSITE